MTEKETHTGMARTADKMQDVVGGMMGRATARSAGSTDDEAFVQNAARGDMFEIAAAKYMLKHSGNETVRGAAAQMLADHTTMSNQLRSALGSSETPDIAIPGSLDERRKSVLDHLQRAPADKLDKTYVDQQVLAHKETVDLLSGYASVGPNPQLRSVALGALPVVKRHLARMEALEGSGL